jgi:hypothetical protein
MNSVYEKIANLALDWREAADLQAEMDAMKKNNPDLVASSFEQSTPFRVLWKAIETACHRSVLYK